MTLSPFIRKALASVLTASLLTVGAAPLTQTCTDGSATTVARVTVATSGCYNESESLERAAWIDRVSEWDHLCPGHTRPPVTVTK